MTKPFPVLLDVVALLRDLPEENLERGAVGTVVEILREPDIFLVEFADGDGRTTAMPSVEAIDLLVLQYESVAAAE